MLNRRGLFGLLALPFLGLLRPARGMELLKASDIQPPDATERFRRSHGTIVWTDGVPQS